MVYLNKICLVTSSHIRHRLVCLLLKLWIFTNNLKAHAHHLWSLFPNVINLIYQINLAGLIFTDEEKLGRFQIPQCFWYPRDCPRQPNVASENWNLLLYVDLEWVNIIFRKYININIYQVLYLWKEPMDTQAWHHTLQ